MATTTKIPCGFPECDFSAEHASETVALSIFDSHKESHKVVASSSAKPPGIGRPNMKQDVTEEEWDAFVLKWRRFKRYHNFPVGQVADQLLSCCESDLETLLLKENPDVIDAGETALLAAMKAMAVDKVAVSVRRLKLFSLKQDHGQVFREFYANVKAQANTCAFSVKCGQQCCLAKNPPAPPVDYTSQVVKDILICGAADNDIRRDILELDKLDEKTDKDIVAFVEAKESAKSAWNNQGSSSSLNANESGSRSTEESEIKRKLSLKAKCAKCGSQISQFIKLRSGKLNRTAFKICAKCHRESKNEPENKPSGKSSETAALLSFVGGLESPVQQSTPEVIEVAKVKLQHYLFTAEGWRRAQSLSHPTLNLEISTKKEDYDNFGSKYVKLSQKKIEVVADSGAQSCLWSRDEFLGCGLKMSDLCEVHHVMEAANAAPIRIDGAIILRLSARGKSGDLVEAAVIVYVSPDASRFYLSKEAMVQLGIINQNFPQVGAAFDKSSGCSISPAPQFVKSEVCDCPRREYPPERPAKLPFEANKENTPKMKAWVEKRFASSTFNKCPHQPLPAITGPPLKIHIDPNAKPVAFLKPSSVPLHWQKQVEDELERDVALGVIERVPHGEPTVWCSRMVVSRRSDGGPRRTTDSSHMNKFCTREAHGSKSPFQLARSVPPGSIKTVMDLWNGYHSVPICEEDRHYTTFTTQYGLFRYCRAPQGYLSSGDGFNRRMDDLTAHIQRLERCVDDNLLHDSSYEDHWWRVLDFLELAGNAGMVVNPEKFQFGEDTVDFAGFRISPDTVEPLPKYLVSIANFPTPKDISDLRSWFGLVNQVSHYAQLRESMAPFRKFLSPKVPFEWTESLQKTFEDSKVNIVEAIKEGVKIYDVRRPTCLITDWSKKGIGYYLAQKHCECESKLYGCCEDGCQITLAGSRFLRKEEENYVAIEGEALAVAWSLEQTRFFTLGCPDLAIITDHKPLLKIFSDKRLDDITSPRMFRFKLRTLMWKFQMQYIQGKINTCADALSRNPSSTEEPDDTDKEVYLAAEVTNSADHFFAVTWEKVQESSRSDDVTQMLIKLIHEGFPLSKKEMPAPLAPFWDARFRLTVHEDVVLFENRIVVPTSLRSAVLDILHSAHQGVHGMSLRAQDAVYWPGITGDIENVRNACRTCHRNAPSQPKAPPMAPEIPQHPFEMIYADFFELHGNHYLIVGDRLSGWTEVVKIKPGTAKAGSKGLCQALRKMFVSFGVPKELSSDGGPEFSAILTEQFLRTWGVRHRISSSYFPQSNGRAEVAVRSTKRLLEDNVETDGGLDSDRLIRALLQLRNTPAPDCRLSPAQVLFGRQLNDAMPVLDKSLTIFENNQIHSEWHELWAKKEDAIRSRLVKSCEALEKGSKDFIPLQVGDHVFIQNQGSNLKNQKKWDREGTILKKGENDQYLVKVRGTGRLTLRNRRFLRKIVHRPANVNQNADIQPRARQEMSSRNDRSLVTDKQPTTVSSDAQWQAPPPLPESQESLVDESPVVQQPIVDYSASSDHSVGNDAVLAPSDVPMQASAPDVRDVSDAPVVRRSTRAKCPRTIYNPASGEYVLPHS